MKKYIPHLICAAGVFSPASPSVQAADPSSALRWHWNTAGDAEGWTTSGMSPSAVSNGFFAGISAGNDPYFLSADNLNLNLAGNPKVYIRARNGSSQTAAAVYFETTHSPAFTGQYVPFTAVANDPGYTNYEVDMSGHTNWNGTLKRLRIDLPNGASTGAQIGLDWVAVGESGTRPNVVFVLCDDFGWNDTSINGSTFYKTPTLERLADRGIRLTSAYTANPLCSPTRASILTGQYPGRLRFTTPAGHLLQVILDPVVPSTAASTAKLCEPQSCTRLKNEYVTYADIMKTAGYSTAFMGKWHLGRDPYIPENQGFDTVIGGRYHSGPPGGYFAPFSEDSNLPTAAAGTHVNDLLADCAGGFIQTNRNRPFLLNLWFYDVHAPFECKETLRTNYIGKASTDGRQKCATMGAMVEAMDTGLGRVLDRLEQLGLNDNTIIVFFSDNGGNMYDWSDGALPTHNWPLRQGKASVYEGGTRVPCVVVWPEKTAPGTVSDGLLSSVDFYPSLLEMTGLSPAPGEIMDGVSQTALFQGGSSARTNVFVHFPHTTPATGTFAGCWVRQGDWKLIRFFHDNPGSAHRYELYNLAADPHEMTDLSNENPALVAQFDALITAHLADTSALLPVPNPAYIPPVYSWEPNVQLHLSTGSQKRLLATANGFEPQLSSAGTLTGLGTPARLVVQMQSRSFGDGRLFWRLPGQTNFTSDRSASFPVIHDNTLRTYEIPFSPGGPVEQLRLQPTSDASETEIAYIQLRDAAGTVLKDWSWQDSDSDGCGDGAERSEGRDPENPGDFGFEWEMISDFEGWVIGNNITNGAVLNGTLQGTAVTSDPQLSISGISLPADSVPSLAIRLKSSASGGLQLYFATAATNTFSAAQLLSKTYTNKPAWQTMVFNLAAQSGWSGQTVTKLRIDPISSAGATFALDWVRASDGDWDKDGVPDGDEPYGDLDKDGTANYRDTDADGDGYADGDETTAGHSPFDPNDQPQFTLQSGTNLTPELKWNGRTARSYRIEHCTNLPGNLWTSVTNIGPVTNNSIRLYHPQPSSALQYFRLKISTP